jgi:gliding motility-associated-like protein
MKLSFHRMRGAAIKAFAENLKSRNYFLTAAFSLIGFAVQAQSNLGPFELQSRNENPLPSPLSFPAKPAPLIVDLDNDGDNDLVVGSSYQGYGTAIHYYKNEGTAEEPFFDEQASWDNPFYYLIYNYLSPYQYISPALGDLDNDGDLDLLAGFINGELRYYRNRGNLEFEEETGEWDEETKTGNPFHGVFAGYYSFPHFVDIDSDGDQDVLLGTYAESIYNSTVHLYINDGNGNFTHDYVNGVSPAGERITITTTDYNKDGDLDIITGDKNGVFRYFDNTGSGVYEEQVGWSILNDLNFGTYTSAAFGNLDNDGNEDLVIGGEPNSGNQTVVFVQNLGDHLYTIKRGIHTPFGGVDVNTYASPVFADVDGDNDEDVIIANNSNYLTYFENQNGKFVSVASENNPFNGVATGDDFCFSYIDLNGDGNRDIVGTAEYNVQYLKFQDNTFVEQPLAEGPFAAIITSGVSKSDFADIDADGDFDLLLSDEVNDDPETETIEWGYTIRFFENTGSSVNPVFEERTDSANPFASVSEEYILSPRFADIDHDGDMDVLIGEGGELHVEAPESNEFLFFENIGSAQQFQFTYRGNLIPQYENAEYFSPAFTDYDNDGDVDVFQGDRIGLISFYKNTNPAASISINETPIETEASTGSLYVDELLTVSDADNDSLSRVIITIGNFEQSDSLTFTWPLVDVQPSINHDFDDLSGQLILSGKASLEYYQTLLRTIKYEFDQNSSIRTASTVSLLDVTSETASSAAILSATKTISFQVYDADFTEPVLSSRVLNIATVPNAPPVIADATASGKAGKVISVDLLPLISDPNGSADIDLTSLKIKVEPSSGAGTTISNAGTLSVSYTSLPFTGTETLKVEVCDLAAACSENTITISISNTAPLFENVETSLAAGNLVAIETSPMIFDTDDNIVASSIRITAAPPSGAPVLLNENYELIVDYRGRSFTGTESATLQICDITGACAVSTFTIHVTNTSPVLSDAVTSASVWGQISIDLLALINDAENNVDLSTLKILTTPASGAPATIDSNQKLLLDYGSVNFAGTETLKIEVCDITGACSENVITVTINNSAPVFQAATSTINFAGTAEIDLLPLLSDPENNIDFSSLTILESPTSGASALINGETLIADYSQVNFAGSEQIVLQVCDHSGQCTTGEITLVVSNSSPEIIPEAVSTIKRSQVAIDLLAITTDPDGNLDPESFEIVEMPFSNATAQISNGVLVLDYSSVDFYGTDYLRVRACDVTSSCTENILYIDVAATDPDGEIEVYNAVAPNGTSANKWMRILNIPAGNKVTIYNRWGDEVFQIEEYDSETAGKRFEGKSNGGNELPSGTYFYKIEFQDPAINTISGYLTLKL